MELAKKSSAVRPTPKPRPKRQRSRVTNGKRTFVEGDGRSPWARRWRDLIELHVADLGGVAALSEAQRSLVKRAATIEIELEQIEGRLSEGKPADLSVYATASAHLRRLFETLGIERRARDMGGVVDVATPTPWSPLLSRLHEEVERERKAAEAATAAEAPA
jgi:hypothetical protein